MARNNQRLKNLRYNGNITNEQVASALTAGEILINKTLEGNSNIYAKLNDTDVAKFIDSVQIQTAINNAVSPVSSKVTSLEGRADTLDTKVANLEQAIGEGGSVSAQIQSAINELDVNNNQSAAVHGLQVTVNETDGKVVTPVINFTPGAVAESNDNFVTGGQVYEKIHAEEVARGAKDDELAADITALKALHANGTSGKKTVVEEINESIAALDLSGTYYSKTAGEANAAAIEKLNGDSTVAGSVDKKVADAIALEVSRADGAYATKTALQTAEAKYDGILEGFSASAAEVSGKTVQAYVDAKVAASVSSVYKVKGSKATFNDLPSNAEIGDVWNIEAPFTLDEKTYPAGTNVVAISVSPLKWDALAGTIDLTPYALKDDLQALQGTVAGHTSSISALNELVGSKSVSSQISDAIDALDNEVTSDPNRGVTVQISQSNGVLQKPVIAVAAATIATEGDGSGNLATGKQVYDHVAARESVLQNQITTNAAAIATNAQAIQDLKGSGEGSIDSRIEAAKEALIGDMTGNTKTLGALQDQIEGVIAQAIDVKGGNGINVSGDGVEKTVSVKLKEGEKYLAVDANGLSISGVADGEDFDELSDRVSDVETGLIAIEASALTGATGSASGYITASLTSSNQVATLSLTPNVENIGGEVSGYTANDNKLANTKDVAAKLNALHTDYEGQFTDVADEISTINESLESKIESVSIADGKSSGVKVETSDLNVVFDFSELVIDCGELVIND